MKNTQKKTDEKFDYTNASHGHKFKIGEKN